MKLITIFFFLFSSCVYGQNRYGNRHDGTRLFDQWTAPGQFRIEDSLEGLTINDSLLNVLVDTLPFYSYYDDSQWRDMKLVFYFYDSAYALRKVSFRNGKAGYYYFYFNGDSYMKKARYLASEPQGLRYDFTADDNKFTILEIEQKAMELPGKRHFYETLKMGKEFFEKFKTLL